MGATVKQLGRERSSSVDAQSSKAVELYRVTFDTVGEASQVAAERADDGTTRIPLPLDPHPHDAARRVSNISASSDPEADGFRVFLVRVSYGSSTFDDQDSEFSNGETAEERLPTIALGSVQRTRAVTKDKDGNPIVNSAGDPFDPPPEVDESDGTVTIRGTIPFDENLPVTLREYRDSVDSSGLFGYEPGQLKIVGQPHLHTKRGADGVIRWGVEVVWHEGDWQLELIDNGLHQATYSVADTGDTENQISISERKRILDDDGNKVTSPVLLDGDGNKLEDGAPVTLTFDVKDSKSHTQMLTTMGLPTTFSGYATN